jgi:bacteriorhodopsin
VATAAQDGEQSQGAQSQGAQSQGGDAPEAYGAEQSSGYEAPQESYAAESYAAPVAYAAPAVKCCVSACPDEAPFFNKNTCSCVAGLREEYHEENYAAASYEAPQQSYGGAQEQSGYRQLQEVGTGPEGTIDTRSLRVQRVGNIILWVTFAILFILACYFLRIFWHYFTVAELGEDLGVLSEDVASTIYYFLANPSLIAGFVCLIASLAYLTMATGNGYYNRCDGRQFYYARYIDWIITTPLLLHALAHFANSPDEIWNFLFFSDIIMIASGLIASTITGTEKWIYFGFSIIAFIPVLYYICQLRDQRRDDRLFDPRTGLLVDTGGVFLPFVWFYHTYKVIADLTVLAWFLYPIVWIAAEGTGKLSVTGEVITYAVLDLISKGLFGWLIVTSEFKDFRH